MKATFKMSDLGLLRYYLGLEVTQMEDGITVSQSAYAAKILQSAGLTGCNPSHTPMEPRLKLSKSSDAPAVDCTMYRSIVGSLQYLVNSRPDLAYSVGYRKKEAQLIGYSDSDLAGDIDTRKSTTGVLFFLGPSIITWQSQKQKLSKNPVFHDRSKHIDVRYHYIWECVEENRVKLESVRTADELADILTKALGRDQFCGLRSRIGVIDV
ncbi:uncharacterized mitochondrial protein AtMg00810-like [Miscanthus floridulus]|uniref:uncharacterized mitochondrial protein AtMg00810-like n=1 Tax=Miscanthus floridulus TaxID=154761 RepID=UPI003457A984